MKKGLADVIIDIRTTRHKISLWKNKIKTRISSYENIKDTKIPEEYKKETAQLKTILNTIEKLDLLLEMLEIKVETIVTVGIILNNVQDVVSAIKEFGKIYPFIGTDLLIEIENIYRDFSSSIDLPKEFKVRTTEGGKRILDEIDKSLNEKGSNRTIEINT
ncbi:MULTISPECIES: hypothetical protein [Acidianus]|uniref:Uncharacterized protein n=1 Tax=Candidatus Acidianus copahuensis TaxID=1160895 RepID=A0A031LP37_9CREN|nr:MULTISPECIES: hypothetical protein [Acidianus]EZQ04939.1 hypothetical protein CM19_07575 [Candidatus Acidianus copahuensis]NON62791.1 hypothetical protein [Acidianus sp. RZ1]